MMDPHVDTDEIVDRYVRHQLAPDQQQAFEDHFFGCEECFDKVQDAERFRSGILDASARLLLKDDSLPVGARRAWTMWALAATACASVVLAAVSGWLYFEQLPTLRNELAQTAGRLDAERQAREATARAVSAADAPEGNVALVMLQASRAADAATSTVLAPDAKRLILWIEVGTSTFRSFRLEVTTPDGRRIASIDRLEKGPYGALSVSLPADTLPAGTLRITLSGQDPPPGTLVGDYQLQIQKR